MLFLSLHTSKPRVSDGDPIESVKNNKGKWRIEKEPVGYYFFSNLSALSNGFGLYLLHERMIDFFP